MTGPDGAQSRPLRRLLTTTALVRLSGTGLAAVGVIVGIRTLGAEQFGLSVIALAIGQMLALPTVGLERLVIRAAAVADLQAVHLLLKGARRFAWCVGVGASILAAGAFPVTAQAGWMILAAGLTAVMVAVVMPRQALNRSAGHLLWGQAPNELFRPAATIAGYLLVLRLPGLDNPGLVATSAASGATLLLGLAAPRPVPRSSEGAAQRSITDYRLASRWLLLSAAASTLLERLVPILLGYFGQPSDVAALAVAVRLVQLGAFGITLANFALSPRLAAAVAGATPDLRAAVRFMLASRALGAAVSLPLAALCLALPSAVTELLRADVGVAPLLPWVAAILALNVVFGPIQTLMIMLGDERVVAWAFCCATAVGLSTFFGLGADSALDAFLAQASGLVVWNTALHGRAWHLLRRPF